MSLIYSALAGIMEKSLNAYLSLDPEMPDLIQALQGKTLKVVVADWNISLFLAPFPKGFRLYLNGEIEAQAQLKGRLLHLIEFGLSSHPQALASSGKIEQSGDVHVLQAYQRFMHSCEVDWEGLFAKVIGEAAAFELCKKAKQAKAWQKDNLSSTCQDFSEYVQEEQRLVPTCEELEDFYEDIAAVRESVERVEARIHLLQSK
ncbi:MAG: sterol-binding protein [Gammaproteobacteria bacterium]|jgi:ubiquinone biosynthesis protein UbiJ|nr:sterol-binding protein [Gammaproteobacteria bacterium]